MEDFSIITEEMFKNVFEHVIKKVGNGEVTLVDLFNRIDNFISPYYPGQKAIYEIAKLAKEGVISYESKWLEPLKRDFNNNAPTLDSTGEYNEYGDIASVDSDLELFVWRDCFSETNLPTVVVKRTMQAKYRNEAEGELREYRDRAWNHADCEFTFHADTTEKLEQMLQPLKRRIVKLFASKCVDDYLKKMAQSQSTILCEELDKTFTS